MGKRFNNPTGNYQKASNGQFGLRILKTGESSVSGEYFVAMIAREESVLDFESKKDPKDESIDEKEFGGDTDFEGFTLYDQELIAGSFTNITVTSGEIIAYLK